MSHASFERILTESDTAVLFIHGILGTPRHFDFLLEHVPPQWSVCNLLLTGHGGDVHDFSKASMHKWRTQVLQAVKKLCDTHQNVMIVAHSMGTLLAIEAAMRYPKQICALFLLATPLRIRMKPVAACNALRMVFNRLDMSDPIQHATAQACSIQLNRRLWEYIGWIPRYTELFAFACTVRKWVPHLAVPCLVYQSAHDEFVSPRALCDWKTNSCVQCNVLEDSAHFYYASQDRARLTEAFADMCNTFGASAEQTERNVNKA